MDLIAALLAIGMIYSAYFNYVIFKRTRSDTEVRRVRIIGYRFLAGMITSFAAAGLFVISAITSSTGLLISGLMVMVVGMVAIEVLRIVR